MAKQPNGDDAQTLQKRAQKRINQLGKEARARGTLESELADIMEYVSEMYKQEALEMGFENPRAEIQIHGMVVDLKLTLTHPG